MRFVRFGEYGNETVGALDESLRIRDFSQHVDELEKETVSVGAITQLCSINLDQLPIVNGKPRIGSCLKDTPNFYCIGLNYRQHAIETGLDIPKEPIIFSKASSCLSGPYDPIIIPKNSYKADWEVELGVIIGQDCEYVLEKNALSMVSGYCSINDISERSFQMDRGGQWLKGKSAKSFGPVGPYFVSVDEIPDPQNLNLQLKVNNEVMQKSNTSDMIFSVAEIISYMSQFLQLRCGDIISTGTPSGVGMGMQPPRFLKPGDRVDLEIDVCGNQKQDVITQNYKKR